MAVRACTALHYAPDEHWRRSHEFCFAMVGPGLVVHGARFRARAGGLRARAALGGRDQPRDRSRRSGLPRRRLQPQVSCDLGAQSQSHSRRDRRARHGPASGLGTHRDAAQPALRARLFHALGADAGTRGGSERRSLPAAVSRGDGAVDGCNRVSAQARREENRHRLAQHGRPHDQLLPQSRSGGGDRRMGRDRSFRRVHGAGDVQGPSARSLRREGFSRGNAQRGKARRRDPQRPRLGPGAGRRCRSLLFGQGKRAHRAGQAISRSPPQVDSPFPQPRLSRSRMSFDSQFRGEPGIHWLVLCLVLLVAVAAVDYATDLNVSLLYLAPVFILAWTYGSRPAILVALFAGAAVFLFVFVVSAGPTYVQGRIYLAWEAVIQFATCVIFAFVIAKLKIALSHADERFATVLEGLDVAVYVSEAASGRLLYANEPFRRTFPEGSPPPALPEDRGQGEVHEVGTGRWFLLHVRPLRWIGGEMAHLHIATEITEQR